MVKQPLITVLMPTYNCIQYIDEAIESILSQTYANFELFIIDDCSTDGTNERVRHYGKLDSRVRVIPKKQRTGYPQSLNMGLKQAQGTYIARMDADDISLPSRFMQQVTFLEKNPQIGVCGSWIDYIGTQQTPTLKYPTKHSRLLIHLFFNKAIFCHPSVMIRKEVLDVNNICYKPEYAPAEDHALWIELSKCCQLANLPEVLLKYRKHPQQVSVIQADTQQHWSKINFEKFVKTTVPIASSKEVTLHSSLFHFPAQPAHFSIKDVHKWLLKLYKYPHPPAFFNAPYFKNILGIAWNHFCHNTTEKGIKTAYLYLTSPLRKLHPIGTKNIIYFIIDCLLKRESRYLK